MEEIILLGTGGHARSIIDSLEKGKKYKIVGYTGIVPETAYRDIPYLGDDHVLKEYFDKGIKNAFVAVGYMGEGSIRDQLYIKAKEIGYELPAIIDPSAIIAGDAIIDEGTFVGKGCIVNAAAHVGKMCILNSGAIVEHDNKVGDFCHIAVHTTLCGNVSVGNHSFIGANATIIQNVQIGCYSIVGAGSIVLRNVKKSEKVWGLVSGGVIVIKCRHYKRAG